jgi:hypothetical protein
MTDVQGRAVSTQEQSGEALRRFADGFAVLRRSPVLHSPSEYGLEYEDVSFPARDGVPLDGWFIPAPGSGKLVIANHPMGLAGPVCPPTFSPGRRTGNRAAMDSQLT